MEAAVFDPSVAGAFFLLLVAGLAVACLEEVAIWVAFGLETELVVAMDRVVRLFELRELLGQLTPGVHLSTHSTQPC